jgi:hypothetical protein
MTIVRVAKCNYLPSIIYRDFFALFSSLASVSSFIIFFTGVE